MPKTIAIFADGTGNAFTTHESNVWRLYQALDLSAPEQIAAYVKGVGTSGVRPFAAIDGATGIGVPSNVRKLYRFLCWNWNEGDTILLFGFSRGAFTIRTLLGLIDQEGLVPREIGGAPVSSAEMRTNAEAAWRSYRRKSVPWYRSLPTIWVARAIRDAMLASTRLITRRPGYDKVREATAAQRRLVIPIAFLGLFDTVEAFGVPIEEMRAAIDWAIWPISFRNRMLSGRVAIARHALSLDDERTTFHPIRFDMTNETTDRIHEVWFAGVHSDVGGGYPDGALAFVPLAWIAGEAKKAGLRFAGNALDGFFKAASALAPLHDSRSGLAVFYRYDPRFIADDRESGGPPVIHHAVAEKMVFGSENYAPITLPDTAMVLMPDGSKHRIAGFSARAATAAPVPGAPRDRAFDAVDKLSAPDRKLAALTLDTVWWRRVAYYALLASAALSVSLPATAYWLTSAFKTSVGALASLVRLGAAWDRFWTWLAGANEGVSANFGVVSKTAGGFLPGYASYWMNVLVARPLTSLIVLAILLVAYLANSTLRGLVADRARLAWFFTGRRAPPSARKRGLAMRLARALRQSHAAQSVYLATTRFILPGLALVAIFAAGAVAVSRTTIDYREASGAICADSQDGFIVPSETPTAATTEFAIKGPCWGSGIRLQKGRRYLLSITMTEPFLDQMHPTDVAGFRASSFPYLLGLPLRRWWTADWFQPIARIGREGSIAWPLTAVDGAGAVDLGFDADGNRLPDAAGPPPGWCDPISEAEARAAGSPRLRKTYVSEFVAPESGELFLYVNDAIAAVPFGPTITCFYRNNSGSAKVKVEIVPPPKLAAGSSAGPD
jgi:uncharacterized protein (DUF2235 family)